MKKLIPAVLAAALLAACGWWWSTRASASASPVFSGTMEARQVLVGSKTGGRVTEVLIDEGRTVEPGQALVRFDVADVRAQREQAEARLREAEAHLVRLRNGFRPEEKAQAEAQVAQLSSQLQALREGPRKQEIAQAEADLRAAEADLANAESVARRVEALASSGDIARQQLDDARARQSVATARVEAARQRVALLRAGTRAEDVRAQQARVEQASAQAALVRAGSRREDIAEAEARLAQARAAIAELDVRLAEGEVRAPAQALVETVSVRPGDLVPAGRSVATLIEPSQIWVRVFVPEPSLALLRVGQPMEVEAAIVPGKWYAAHVEQIATQGEFLPRNVQTREDREHLVYGVRVRIDARDHPLKPGMAANARIAGSGPGQ
ncbi:MAG: HlyD family efflux transporter periplasmic adaptor subunit [Bryobacteraceae bacterium]